MPFNDTSDPSSVVISFTADPKRDFGVFAEGYTRAANRLAASLLEAPRFSDYEAYPVVFLYRHALELSLKHVVYAGSKLAAFRRMDQVHDKLLNNHKLTELSDVAGKVLSSLFPSDEVLADLSITVAGLCKDWSEIDPDSYSYRYPIDKKGSASTKKHQTINLRELSSRMASVLEDLDTVHFGLSIETDIARDVYEVLEQFVSEHAS